MCNITLKPEQDDPATLKQYAYMHDALLPGWTFLTGDRYDVDTLRYAFFRHDHIGIDADTDIHAGMMKIVNDSIGRWVHTDVFATTRTFLDHITWTDPPKTLEQRLEDNRRLQQEINKDVDRHGYRKTV
jgi:cytochrome oxidase Cu insertion factor (SCO1/SenC/PrrC family)